MAEVHNRSSLSGDVVAELQRRLAPYSNLYEVLTSAGSPSLGLSFTRSIEHDDGTHDHLATRHTDALVLCFSTSPTGVIDSVSIWDRQPTSAELLAVRGPRSAPAPSPSPAV